MELTGEQMIAAPRQKVWAALNDPEVLRQSIDGCEAFDRTSDTSFAARVVARIGPVRAGFGGAVTLTEIDPPNGYVLVGEGTGAGAGFARGQARVRLTEVGGGATRLSYEVRAEVGGKLAQIGARLIDQTARRLADDFFMSFAAIVGEGSLAQLPVARPRGPGWLAVAIMVAAALAIGFLAGRLWP